MKVLKLIITIVFIIQNYDSSLIKNDVSIIKVDAPFEFNSNVAPIQLPAQGYYPEGWKLSFRFQAFFTSLNFETSSLPAGTVCTNSGWGKINNEPIGNTPNKLQVVDLPIVDLDVCVGWYQGINPVSESEVCAGTAEGGISPCNVRKHF